jgi:hypothetical protein
MSRFAQKPCAVGDWVPADERPPANLSVRFVTRDECELSLLDGDLIQVATLRLRTRSPVAKWPALGASGEPAIPIVAH